MRKTGCEQLEQFNFSGEVLDFFFTSHVVERSDFALSILHHKVLKSQKQLSVHTLILNNFDSNRLIDKARTS